MTIQTLCVVWQRVTVGGALPIASCPLLLGTAFIFLLLATIVEVEQMIQRTNIDISPSLRQYIHSSLSIDHISFILNIKFTVISSIFYIFKNDFIIRIYQSLSLSCLVVHSSNRDLQSVPINVAFLYSSIALLFLSQNNGFTHQNKRLVFPYQNQTVVLSEEERCLE